MKRLYTNEKYSQHSKEKTSTAIIAKQKIYRLVSFSFCMKHTVFFYPESVVIQNQYRLVVGTHKEQE